MMKSVSLLACATTFFAVGTASAGSLNDPVITPVTPAIEDPSPWQGAYVGGTLGYHFAGGDRIGLTPAIGPSFSTGEELNIGGPALSLRAGYRWQFNDFVVGGEIAAEAGNVEDSFAGGGYSGSTKLNHALSLRLKAGVASKFFGSFIYGTVGLSRAEFDYVVSGSGGGGAVSFDETYSTNGYILGVGFERPLADRWTLTGDYEYVNFGTDELTDGGGTTTLATPLFHTIKLGVNYNF
ncbi:outer membrane beta-barrel protein [Aliiroseovarius sp. S1123]|uniref:outer membrane protein n=1 Tax=unclassified Aliiroseovarius TaxID=2623558 RepID=UPI001FF136A8|nr:outer membrane beta-barrel protein [Aliiroseovarius sp. S1123]MCK0169785.1 outer membrane beta-barrel protein [Aliiroseovarius sp. S1123]